MITKCDTLKNPYCKRRKKKRNANALLSFITKVFIHIYNINIWYEYLREQKVMHPYSFTRWYTTCTGLKISELKSNEGHVFAAKSRIYCDFVNILFFLYVCQRKFLGNLIVFDFKEQYGNYLPAQHAIFILDEAPQFCIYLETLWNCTNTKKYLNYSFNESFYLQYCAYFRLLYPFYGGSLFWLDKQISRVFVTSLWNLNRFLKAVLSL